MAANFPDTFHLERARSQLLADLVGEKYGFQPQMTLEELYTRLEKLQLLVSQDLNDYKNLDGNNPNHYNYGVYGNYILKNEIYKNATSGYPAVSGLIPNGLQIPTKKV